MYNTFLGFPHLQSGPNSVELTIKPNMTFNLTYTSQDFPRFNNWLTWGSRELRWDIFDAEYTEADWKYPPVVGENHCTYKLSLIPCTCAISLRFGQECRFGLSSCVANNGSYRFRHELERHRQCDLLRPQQA